MKQENQQMFTIDLAKIEGDGDFPCPRCGVTISPEDETENTYTIVDTKVNGEALQELTIQCNKCRSKIRLIGFVS
jgi:phage terminase large subunit GpA-like protein